MKKTVLAFCILCLTLFPASAFADVVTMNFTDVPVHYVLSALGDTADLNFAISKDAGAKTVSIALNGVSIADALSMIEVASAVSIKEIRPRYYVVTAEKERKEDERMTKASTDKEIMKTSLMKAFDVKYVSVDDVEKSIQQAIGDTTAFKISRLAQDEKRAYGRLVVYAADQEVLSMVEGLIKTLDVPKPMIEIEAIFVETTRDKNGEFGIEWTAMTEPLTIAEQIPEGELGEVAKFGTFMRTNAWQSEALLKAVRTDGHSRVLANPRMKVISGMTAEFASETQVPILSRDSDGDINTEWKNVGISLVIMPTRLEDGTIRLHVAPRVSSIIGEKKLGDVVAPVISERKSETTVFLRDGETMIIGGLMSDREIKTMSKVPVLHQIPLFGELFKSNKTQIEKSNIMIILRPREVYENTGAEVPEKPAFLEKKPSADDKDAIIDRFRQDVEKLDAPAPKTTNRVEVKPLPLKEKQAVKTEQKQTAAETKKPEVKKPEVKPAPVPAPVQPRFSDQEYKSRINDLFEQYGVKETKKETKPEEKNEPKVEQKKEAKESVPAQDQKQNQKLTAEEKEKLLEDMRKAKEQSEKKKAEEQKKEQKKNSGKLPRS